ncbi:hypothetical protein BX611_0771 [Lutibacter oceani]|uniref:TonB-dependent receptor-like protein n=1 Tax=Lutibacter oceani TaxID=1853311 RepID=A0A3D9RU38_9FLAO|nr:hypothetical protein [Lutibacter oceani]REE83480.1 hypothetical protein BX611_0771 [Lutibacter oceani]
MKNLKTLIILLFLFSSHFSFSQEVDINSSIIEPFQSEALFREKVFIHINKTRFFNKENIWFTAYVSNDFDNSPSDYTTNLKVNLLNDKGALIESKNIFIQKGVGIGDFLIADNYSGKYYIQGYTNYMQNFGLENTFIQEIEIINPSEKKEIDNEKYINNYDIQVFPESGYLLEGIENIVGIKVLINGKGYPFLGKIVNSKEKEITTFEGNPFGMSKCKFTYNKNETYKAFVTINGTIKKIDLPKAHKTGINFSIDNTNSDKIILTLKTNKETLPTLKNETLALIFYRNNYISKAVTLSLTSNEELTQKLVFERSEMQHGVNIVTLFKNNQPIAERKFFNDKESEQSAILIEELKTENDSTSFKIRTINSDFKPILAQLSISILPKDSKVFKETQTIKSAFLLSPYIKGGIENPSFYFKNTNPKEKEYLDLLLLNQGWSTYSLEEKIKEINPKEKYVFESGFILKGNVKKAPKGYDIGILSKKNSLAAFSNLNEDREFTLKNVFAYKNDSVKIAFIKKNEPLVKPNGVSFIKTESVSNSSNYNTFINNSKLRIEEGRLDVNEKKNSLNYKYYPNIELLDEVMLKNVKTKKKATIYDIEANLALKHNVISSGFYKNKKVTKQMEIMYQTVFDYFMSLGYIKRINLDTYQIVLRRTPATLKGAGSGVFPPRIYINDQPLIRDITLIIERLQGITMSDIDEILINKSGGGGGMDGTGGIIKIYIKKGDRNYFEEEGKNLYENLVLLTGFDKASNYYKPQYNIYSKEAFNWTEIDWKNLIQTNEKGEIVIKIPTNEFSNEFQFIINGFSEEGLLFHDIYKSGNDGF